MVKTRAVKKKVVEPLKVQTTKEIKKGIKQTIALEKESKSKSGTVAKEAEVDLPKTQSEYI